MVDMVCLCGHKESEHFALTKYCVRPDSCDGFRFAAPAPEPGPLSEDVLSGFLEIHLADNCSITIPRPHNDWGIEIPAGFRVRCQHGQEMTLEVPFISGVRMWHTRPGDVPRQRETICPCGHERASHNLGICFHMLREGEPDTEATGTHWLDLVAEPPAYGTRADARKRGA